MACINCFFSTENQRLLKEFCFGIERFENKIKSYKEKYIKDINDLKNYIFQVLINVPSICKIGGNIGFHDKNMSPNIDTINHYMQRSILCEILTFPTECNQRKNRPEFVEEYVLPQVYTTLLIEEKYNGIAFLSTKKYNDITSYNNSFYFYNIAMFVKYNGIENYDKESFEIFYPFIIDCKNYENLTIDDILKKFEKVSNYHREYADKVNNNDYVTPIAMTISHINDLRNAKIGKINYFDTTEGKLELNFYSKLSDKMFELIKIRCFKLSKNC